MTGEKTKFENIRVSVYILCIQLKIKVSKVGNCNQGWPEGSLFDSYYTKV